MKKNNIDNSIDITEWLPAFDIAAESDNQLSDYFVKTSYMQDLLTTNKFLVLGRKGSGKTAIIKYLQNNSQCKTIEYYRVISLNFGSYPWPIHSQLKNISKSEKSEYETSWRYVFAVTIIRDILNDMSDSEIKKDSNLKKWNCFIKSVYQEDFSVDTIFKSRKSINSFAVTAFSVGGSVGLSKDEYSDDQNLDIVSTIDAVSKALEELIINYVGTRKYLITLDELDETWTAEEKNKYKNVLIGLFSECFRMNNDFNEKAKTNQIKICPFVRTEIYDDLAFNDKNKIREGKSIEIMWTAKTLDEMFFTRVQYYKQRWNNDNLNKQVDIQKEAFSSDQSTRIFNQNSVKHQISPFRHVLRSSFYRPRDIISYMNKIRDSHKRAESQEFKVYTSADLRNAEKDYSRAMYRELVDEFSPLEEKYHFNSLADALRKIKYQTFSYNKFNIVYQAICSEDTTKGLEFLFSISALGQRVGNNYKYRFDDPFLVMDESKMFYVNPAIKWSLNIVEGTAK